MAGDEYPCGEFDERRICLSEVWELASKLTSADLVTWHLLPHPHCQVRVPKVGVLLVYCPSLILLDIISIPAIADYCGWEHHVFERADRNQDI